MTTTKKTKPADKKAECVYGKPVSANRPMVTMEMFSTVSHACKVLDDSGKGRPEAKPRGSISQRRRLKLVTVRGLC